MIEGGVPGGSAQGQAAERRAHAERLVSEATRLEATAADERAMAGQLSQLPSSYAILHDLTLPGGRGLVDHLVIGPGGAFLVASRRVDGVVSYQHEQLYAGTTSLKPILDSARVEAQALTQSLGTPVVPVVGLVGAPVPADAPPAIEGVLVTPTDQTAHVITRGSHTLLPSTKVGEIAERAAPLLTSPGTRLRAGATPPQGAAPVAAVPAPPPLPAAAPPPNIATADATTSAKPSREPWQARLQRDLHSRRFVIAAIVSACLVAFAAGALIRVLVTDQSSDAAASTTALPTGTTLSVATTLAPTTTAAGSAPVASIPAPAVAFLPVCPGAGSGWSLVPMWPGPVKGLDHYEVAVLGSDGTWEVVSTFATDNTLAAGILGQAPNTTITARITAVLTDGSRSPATATPVITPATAC